MATGTRSVVWTASASAALNEVIQGISEDSFTAAARALDTILDTAATLSTMAMRGRIVPEIGNKAIKEVFVYDYRLMYEVSPSTVRILAIVHGARDFGRNAVRPEP